MLNASIQLAVSELRETLLALAVVHAVIAARLALSVSVVVDSVRVQYVNV